MLLGRINSLVLHIGSYDVTRCGVESGAFQLNFLGSWIKKENHFSVGVHIFVSVWPSNKVNYNVDRSIRPLLTHG